MGSSPYCGPPGPHLWTRTGAVGAAAGDGAALRLLTTPGSPAFWLGKVSFLQADRSYAAAMDLRPLRGGGAPLTLAQRTAALL